MIEAPTQSRGSVEVAPAGRGPARSCGHHDRRCGCLAPGELALLVDRGELSRRVPRFDATALRARRDGGARGAMSGAAEVLVVGRLVTMDPRRPEAGALAVRDGRIVALGDPHELEAWCDASTQVVDVADGVGYPGFVEPHMHLWASSMLDGWVDCSPLRRSGFDEIVDAIAAAAPTRDRWTLGAHFDPSLIPNERELTRDVLDAVVPDRPVMVLNASLHFAYVNTYALELAGLDDDTPDPPGGFFARDESGRLTGALGEGPAMAVAMRLVPRASHDEFVDALVAVTRRARGRGVTKVHDASTGMVLGRPEIDLLHAMSDRLATRASYSIYDGAYEALLAGGLEAGSGDEMVRAVSWKLISDGSNQGRSGHQYEPYLGGDHRGHANVSVDYMADQIRLGHELGWQMMIHANGDAAIGDVLDAYEASLDGSSGLAHRDRIEHCSVPTDEQLATMARLGVSPSFLMNHVYYWGRVFAERIFGPDKAGRLDPVASARRHGLRPSLHSDYTVTEIDPLRTVQTAVTRRVRDGGAVLNADECVSAAEAMRAVTIDAAWQIHADHEIGSLEVGKLADVVVLGADPVAAEPDEIAEIPIIDTLLAGRPDG